MGETGKIKITAKESKGGNNVKVYHTIYKFSGDEDEPKGKRVTGCYSEQKACKAKIPVGKYLVESRYNQLTKRAIIEIEAGKTLKLNVIMGETGKLKIVAKESKGGENVNAYHAIYKFSGDEEEPKGKRVTSCNSREKACKEKIPVGKYVVESSYNKFKKINIVDINASKTTELVVIMGQTGKLRISASETEGSDFVKAYHAIYKFTDDEDEVGKHVAGCGSYVESVCKKRLPAGKYIVKTVYNKIEKRTVIEIKSGKTAEVNVVMGQTTKIKFSASLSEGGANIKAYHTIYKYIGDDEEEGKFIAGCTSYSNKECTKRVPVGKYIIRTVYKRLKKHTVVELKANKITNVHVIMKKPEPTKEELIKADTQAGVNVEKKPEIKKQETHNQVEKSSLTDAEKKTKKSIDVKDIGALIGAISNTKDGVQNKLLQAYKASITKTLPYMQKLPECYNGANVLQEAAKCDNFANEGLEVAAKAMSDVMGITPKKHKPIAHSNWSKETKQRVYKQSLKDLKNAKLTLTCIEAGANLSGLQKCVKNGGKVVKSNNAMEQLGSMLEMFSGQK